MCSFVSSNIVVTLQSECLCLLLVIAFVMLLGYSVYSFFNTIKFLAAFFFSKSKSFLC